MAKAIYISVSNLKSYMAKFHNSAHALTMKQLQNIQTGEDIIY